MSRRSSRWCTSPRRPDPSRRRERPGAKVIRSRGSLPPRRDPPGRPRGAEVLEVRFQRTQVALDDTAEIAQRQFEGVGRGVVLLMHGCRRRGGHAPLAVHDVVHLLADRFRRRDDAAAQRRIATERDLDGVEVPVDLVQASEHRWVGAGGVIHGDAEEVDPILRFARGAERAGDGAVQFGDLLRERERAGLVGIGERAQVQRTDGEWLWACELVDFAVNDADQFDGVTPGRGQRPLIRGHPVLAVRRGEAGRAGIRPAEIPTGD